MFNTLFKKKSEKHAKKKVAKGADQSIIEAENQAAPVVQPMEPMPYSEDVTQTLAVPELYDIDHGDVADDHVLCETAEAASFSLIGTRSYQQDMARLGGEGQKTVCVLCDGMGGLSGGEKASALAAEGMFGAMMTCESVNYPLEMCKAAANINEQVKKLTDDSGRPIEAGTTLTAVIVCGSGMFWCSIGDSHIYLYRGGRMRQLNDDHNLGTQLDQMVRDGVMSEATARSHPKRAALTSYLGISELTLIDRNPNPIQLQPGDMILQCSDGLYRCMSESAMAEMLSSCQSVSETVRLMVETAVAKPGAHDNTTALLTRYVERPVPVQPPVPQPPVSVESSEDVTLPMKPLE